MISFIFCSPFFPLVVVKGRNKIIAFSMTKILGLGIINVVSNLKNHSLQPTCKFILLNCKESILNSVKPVKLDTLYFLNTIGAWIS